MSECVSDVDLHLLRISASITHKTRHPTTANRNALTMSRGNIAVHSEVLVNYTNMADG
jgi:hypothetical protein